MRRIFGFLLAMILMFSFCFVLSGLTQEAKEKEGVYTIQKGDTLWDISSKFLKDPFLWPKLWEKNPYITNPHWIYPGNTLQLTDVETARKEEPPKAAAEKPQEPLQELGSKEPGAAKAESPAAPPVEKKQEEVADAKPEVRPEVKPEVKPEARPEVKPEVSSPPVGVKPPYFSEDRYAGFMSSLEYRGIGIVLESREGKNYMSEGDIVYLAIKTSEPVVIGNKYTVFRAAREIRHPVTDQRVGRKYLIIGVVKVIDQNNNFYTAKVLECFDAVWIGDYIQPYSKEKMEGYLAK